MNLKELVTKRNELDARFNELATAKESRDLNSDEQTEIKSVMNELDELDEKIKEEEAINARKLKNTKEIKRDNNIIKEEKMNKRYSLTKAFNEFRQGGMDGLTGVEKMVHEYAAKQAEARGVKVEGLPVPEEVIEGRAINVQGNAGEGKEAVTIETNPLEGLYYPKTFAARAGIREWTGLTQNQAIPYHTQGAVSAWEGELDAASESTARFKVEKLEPHRLATFMQISKQFLIQDSIGADMALISDLKTAQRQALEKAVLYGTGTNDQPLGIFEDSNVATMSLGTNGAKLDWGKIIDMQTALATQDADLDNIVYLTNWKVFNSLRKEVLVDGTDSRFIIDGKNMMLDGHPIIVTNLVKSDGTKGTSNSKLSGMILGNFSKSILATWGGVDLLIDDSSSALAKKGMVEYVINSYHDFKVVRPENFVKVIDIVTE